MRVVTLFLGIAIGAAGAFGWMIYGKHGASVEPDDNIVFAPKMFFDSKQTAIGEGYLAVSGTLTGKGLGYPNNTYSIVCFGDRNECVMSYVQQIGYNQVGRMEAPTMYPIVRWAANELVARNEELPADCARTTITIDRKTEVVLWVEEPINQTKPKCKDSDNSTYKWTIEDSPGWKRVFKK